MNATGIAPDKSIVLVGMMGAGKSCIGRRLAQALEMPFFDSDTEVETAAALSIDDIFQCYGEVAFRDCERRVIARLLEGSPAVIATGGGAFMDDATRDLVLKQGLSIWLRADLELLLRRVSRRNNRPILKRGDPRQILTDLIARRYPVYGNAELVVDSADIPAEAMTQRVLDAIMARLEKTGDGQATKKCEGSLAPAS
ncbi:MAG: shikimate kinase [Pseudomonadota bacterium]